MAKKPRVDYTEEIGKKVCEHIATSSKSLKAISKLKGMPSSYTITKWASDKDKPEFKKAYEDAYRVRVNNWVEERDELSRESVLPLSPKKIADKYDLWYDARTPKEVEEGAQERLIYDLRLVNKYVSEDTKSRQNHIRQRIDTLTRNIGQIAAMYDRRFVEQKNVTGKIEGEVEHKLGLSLIHI